MNSEITKMSVKKSETPYNKCLETLGNELRINILKLLSEGPKTVQEIEKELQVEQSRLSHSLKRLRECNYVDVETVGRKRKYSLKSELLKGFNDKHKTLFEVLDAHFQKYCEHCKIK